MSQSASGSGDPADLRQCAQPTLRLRTRVRVLAIPHVTGEHRADHAADFFLLSWKEDHVLQAAVVPAGHEGAEGLDAIIQLIGELALPVDARAAQLAVERRG